MLKKIDYFILRTFLTLFVLVFCVTVFMILMTTFLSYIQILIGKGLTIGNYTQFFSYLAMRVTPLSLSITILVASVMSLGGLSEHGELIALKSAGVSLIRIMRPLWLLAVFITICTFFANSYFVPKITLNLVALFNDIKKKKPALLIKEGVFYDGIPGYSIKVNKKHYDSQGIEDIMIYDHTQENGSIAKSGNLYTIQDEAYLVIELFNGCNYQEQARKYGQLVPPMLRSEFTEQRMVISLEELQLSRSPKEHFGHHSVTKNIKTLNEELKDCREKLREELDEYHKEIIDLLFLPPEPNNAMGLPIPNWDKFDIKRKIRQATIDSNARRFITDEGLANAKRIKRHLESSNCYFVNLSSDIRSNNMALHKMFSLALNCLLSMIIGAALGVLIKKGGIGVPIFISAILIIFYYVIELTCGKLGQTGQIPAWLGTWIPEFVLVPFAILLTQRAYHDSHILEFDSYLIWWKNFKKKRFLKKIFKQ